MTTDKGRQQRIAALRKALADRYGARRYRITVDGDVHVYGQMPNSIVTGWWYMGDLEQAEQWMDIDGASS